MYRVRITVKVENENSVPGDLGHGLGWHYHEEDQDTIDDNLVCPNYPTALVTDFVIISAGGPPPPS